MSGTDPVRVDAGAFDLPGGGRAAALCLHGLTGTPYEVRPLGEALAAAGIRALGPALQSVGVTQGYYLFYAAPYVLTLAVMIATSSGARAMTGAPGELSITK